MPRYVIGDIHGCCDSLEALLEALAFDRARDHLILVGDLVNRGPRSVDVLRLVAGLGDCVEVVLGNHDLHLLGRARGLVEAKRRDTIADVLRAPDRKVLVEWLHHGRLLIQAGTFTVVHAGLAPGLELATAFELAAELETALRGDGADAVLVALRRPPLRFLAARTRAERQQAALQGFTLLRACLQDGTPEPHYSGTLADLPAGRMPWFLMDAAGRAGTTVVFGHWAALGLYRSPGVVCVDSGCCWGRGLSALCLEDGRIRTVPTREPGRGLD